MKNKMNFKEFLNEGSFKLGDWVEINTGEVGEVTEIKVNNKFWFKSKDCKLYKGKK